MKYFDVLEKVNYFMDNSRIRTYCRETCGGRCCKGCSTTIDYNNLICNLKLQCSTSLCNEMIFKIDNEIIQTLEHIHDLSLKELQKIDLKRNAYFTIWDLSTLESINIDISPADLKILEGWKWQQ